MGWAAGSKLAIPLIEIIKETLYHNEEARYDIYCVLLDEFLKEDWDTVDEAMNFDPVFDKVVKDTLGEIDD